MPQLINQIFQDLTVKQRNTLMETLVTHLDLKLTPAFDSLNLLLDSQIKQKNCSMEFLAFLPAFVLPVIKSIQDQQKIYGNRPVSIMKILAKLLQLLPLNLAQLDPP